MESWKMKIKQKQTSNAKKIKLIVKLPIRPKNFNY